MATTDPLQEQQPQEYNQLPHYNYTELPTKSSIRLLTNLEVDEKAAWSIPWRGREHAVPKLVCSLKTVDLRECPRYECVSYTCGNPLRVFANREDYVAATEWYDTKIPIAVDGAVLWISSNLFSFLHMAVQFLSGSLRKHQKFFQQVSGIEYSDHLWIDAICIHQEDNEEKSHQVSMMDQIYSNASVVLAWLGDHHANSKQAIQDLRIIAELDQAALDKAKSVNIIHGDTSQFGFEERNPGTGIYALLKRAYFRRAWIMQEQVLAKRLVVFCGHMMFPFGTILSAAMKMWHTGWWGTIANDARSRMRTGVGVAFTKVIPERFWRNQSVFQGSQPYEPDYERFWDPLYMLIEVGCLRRSFGTTPDSSWTTFLPTGPTPERPSYKELFTRYRGLECGDLRDRIFALLGLRPSIDIPEALQPVYDGDTNARKIFIAATSYIIRTDKNLALLCHRGVRKSAEGESLPSWVPDYASQVVYSIGDHADAASCAWSAAGDRRQYAHMSPANSDNLDLRGHRIDIVKSSADGEYDPEDLRLLSQVLQLLRCTKLRYPGTVVDDASSSQDESVTMTTTPFENTAGSSQVRQSVVPSEEKSVGPQRGSRLHLSTDDTLDQARYESKFGSTTMQDDNVCRGSQRTTAPQTRCEMLWRTLISDTIDETNPAPSHYGGAFAYSLTSALERLAEAASIKRGCTFIHPNQPQADIAADFEMSSDLYQDAVESATLLERMEKQDYDTIQMMLKEFAARAPAPSRVLSSLYEHLDDISEFFDPYKDVKAQRSEVARPSTASAFNDKVMQLRGERHLFVTEKHGYLGYGPADLRPGDEIWLLEGANVPFILRPSDQGGYQLIGESYVHGVMHGEAVAEGTVEFVPLVIH